MKNTTTERMAEHVSFLLWLAKVQRWCRRQHHSPEPPVELIQRRGGGETERERVGKLKGETQMTSHQIQDCVFLLFAASFRICLQHHTYLFLTLFRICPYGCRKCCMVYLLCLSCDERRERLNKNVPHSMDDFLNISTCADARAFLLSSFQHGVYAFKYAFKSTVSALIIITFLTIPSE